MNDTPIHNLLRVLRQTTGHKPIPSGDRWKTRCPSHDDEKPSLSIAEGDDGRALVHCHAGCTVDAICAAVGLKPADLFVPPTESTSTKPRQPRKKSGLCGQDNGKPAAKTFPTAKAAIVELERKLGKRSGSNRCSRLPP